MARILRFQSQRPGLIRTTGKALLTATLAAIACAGVQPVGAVGSGFPRPKPIEAALDLLRWSPDQIPTIVVVAECPQTMSTLAEGWVIFNSDGRAQPTIYIAGWSKLYRDALANPDFWHKIIRLAGVLAHERAHIRDGPDEEMAYAAQLTMLVGLHADLLEITNVRRALGAVRRRDRAHP